MGDGSGYGRGDGGATNGPVRLGPLHRRCEEDPVTGQWRPRPVAATEVPDVAVLIIDEDQPVAIARACPHRGADLTCHASITDGREISCRHRGYRWAYPSGRLVSAGGTGAAGPLRVLGPVVVDADGVAWIVDEGDRP